MKIRLRLGIFWWLHPVPAVVLALVPFLIVAHLMEGPDYFDLWRTEKHLDFHSALSCAAIVFAFVGGSFVYTVFRRRNTAGETPISYRRVQILFLFSYMATLIGYASWVIVCGTHGVGLGQVIAVFRGDIGAVYAIRDLGTTIPGLTTATQFAMATGIFGALLWNHRPSFYVGSLLVLLILMSMVRAMLWSERLAAIEVFIPMMITLFARRDWDDHPRIRRLIGFAPLIGCVVLYLYFTASESTRSWGHYAEGGGSIWYFSWTRLCGYYITALNNGAMIHKVIGTVPFPYTALEMFWKFPGITSAFPYDEIFSVDPYAYLDSLKAMGNPEFNNPSGIFPYIVDFGSIGACGFFFVAGWACTGVYTSFTRGRLLGVLCFPLLFVSFLEIARIPYLTASRTLPSWGMLILGVLVLKKHPRTARPSRFRRRAGEPAQDGETTEDAETAPMSK